MLALLAPDSSQTPGMLSSWLELSGAADRVATGPVISAAWTWHKQHHRHRAEEINDTAVTQPLVVAATLLAHEELARRGLIGGKDIVVAATRSVRSPRMIAGVISASNT